MVESEPGNFVHDNIPAMQLQEVRTYLESILLKAKEEIAAQEKKLTQIGTGEAEEDFARDMELFEFDAEDAAAMRERILNPATYRKNINYYQDIVSRISDAANDFQSKKFDKAIAFLTHYAKLREAFWQLPLLDRAEERMREEQALIKKLISFLQ